MRGGFPLLSDGSLFQAQQILRETVNIKMLFPTMLPLCHFKSLEVHSTPENIETGFSPSCHKPHKEDSLAFFTQPIQSLKIFLKHELHQNVECSSTIKLERIGLKPSIEMKPIALSSPQHSHPQTVLETTPKFREE